MCVCATYVTYLSDEGIPDISVNLVFLKDSFRLLKRQRERAGEELRRERGE